MELRFKGSFKRDLEKCNKIIAQAVFEEILEIKKAKSKKQIQQLKKLKKYKTYYRIKIEEEYRIGIIIRKEKVWLVRIGHRSNFYDSFP